MAPERIEIVHCWPLRENSGSDSIQFIEVTVAVESKVCLLDIKVEDLTKTFKCKLMWCLLVFLHDLHGQNLLQGKEKLLLKYMLCFRRSCLRPPPLYSNWITQNKDCGGITKWMNFNCLRHWNSENIEPNDNNLELNVISDINLIFSY